MAVPFDEFWLSDGEPRGHQRRLWSYLSSLDEEGRRAVARTVKRRVREQDVSYNLYGAAGGSGHAWSLDWVPALLSREDFRALDQGLRQRATVLAAALDDLYGPQRLLKDAVIPPSVILGSPFFARVAHGWEPLGGSRLVLYAADVARSPDGSFVVFSDRSGAPTGSGYALQNRIAVGRALPDVFQQHNTARVNGYFSAVADTLAKLAPRGRDKPRIVVLTPGPSDESAFEHACVSRYLGFDLVEGRDLTVREGKLFLKSLTGLQPVDVILRRVFDPWCDPLQLRGDSTMGVPGLVEMARRGSVGIANPIGSMLVESPVFKAYLPVVCRALLGERLELQSVSTRWCGDPSMLEEVIDTRELWRLKPAYEERRHAPIEFGVLEGDELDAMVRRLRSEPERWVAEQWPRLSTTITATCHRSEAALALRFFLCRAPGASDYTTMPSALGRVDASPDGVFIDPGGDRTSKDVWVPSDRGSIVPRLPAMPEPPTALLRGGIDPPSRLLDDVYWLGRYVERCGAAARLLRMGLEDRINSASDLGSVLAGPLQAALADMEIVPHVATAPSTQTILETALLEGRSPHNLPACLRRVHGLSDAVRGRVSRDAWDALRGVRDSLNDLAGAPTDELLDSALEAMQRLMLYATALRGHVLDGMVRGHVWRFMDTGRRLERAASVLSTMRAFLPVGATRQHMEALLEACDGLLTYRARYLSTLQVAPVVDLLLTDVTNPQSVLHQVDVLLTHTASLPRQSDAELTPMERGLVRLRAALLSTDVVALCAGSGEALRSLLDTALEGVWHTADDLARQCFAHVRATAADNVAQWVEVEAL